MNDMLEALTTILSAEVALDQWDAPPSLGLLARSAQGPLLVPVEFSPEFWQIAPPADLLAIVAVALEHPDRPAWASFPAELPEGYDLTGICFFTEGWTLNLDGLPPKAKAEAMKLAEKRLISEHPNRVEVKMIAAQDRDGKRYSTQYRRGDESPFSVSEDVAGESLGGRVYDALDRILKALESEPL